MSATVADYRAAQIVEAIKKAPRTGWAGDGKVFVLSVAEIVRIRTSAHGSHAI